MYSNVYWLLWCGLYPTWTLILGHVRRLVFINETGAHWQRGYVEMTQPYTENEDGGQELLHGRLTLALAV